jgi:hypothetical protein
VADAIIKRTRRRFRESNLGDYRAVEIGAVGADAIWGPHGTNPREVVMKVSVHHDEKAALEIFGREISPFATGSAPGMTGFARGRPKPDPMIRLFSCLVPKTRLRAEVRIGDQAIPVETPTNGGYVPSPAPAPAAQPVPPGPRSEVPLMSLAWGRSGDKGNSANVGLMSRKPEYAGVIREQVTEQTVKAWFAHLCQGKVTRFELPGIHGFNFLLENALGGGGIASLRTDTQAKTYAQLLLDMPVQVPAAWGLR